MKIIDLTAPFSDSTETSLREVPLRSDKTAYTGMVYRFNHESMATTYLDLPGHIRETDDGRNGENLNIADYYRQPARLLRIPPRTGGITPDDLKKAAGGKKILPFTIIHSFGRKDDGNDPQRLTYLTLESCDFLIGAGVKVLLSDAWESRALEGVFLRLFSHGVSTICNLHRMWELPEDRDFLLNVIPLPYPGGATQLLARVFAEIPEP